MSFLTDLISKLEPIILSVLENLITKGERQGGSVSVADLREARDEIQRKVSEQKQTAETHEAGTAHAPHGGSTGPEHHQHSR